MLIKIIKLLKLFCQKKNVLVCLEPTKTFLAKCFIIFKKQRWKIQFWSFQEFFHNIMVDMSKKVITNSNAFEYLRYKEVFIDENQKQSFQIWKTLKSNTNFKMPSKNSRWISITNIDLIHFMKINKRKLMITKKLLVPDRLVLFWYTSIYRAIIGKWEGFSKLTRILRCCPKCIHVMNARALVTRW